MKTPALIIQDLSIGYRLKNKEKIVATHLNAELKTGELTCLLGPNGAGKSTLLRTLALFLPAISGHIGLLGTDLSCYSNKALSKIISIVLTEPVRNCDLTTYDVISLGRSPYTGFFGRISDKDEQKILDSMDLMEITELKERKVISLSDGERQKVMIAKAIAQETPIILLDEPTAYLDYPSKVQLMLTLRHLTRELHKTIFFSTHDLNHALQLGDQLWLLDGNGHFASGTPEDLCLNNALAQCFCQSEIEFNPSSCSFSIKETLDRQISVSGDPTSLRFQMCCRALKRIGISPVSGNCKYGNLTITDQSYELEISEKKQFSAHSIGQLIDELTYTDNE